MLRLSRKTLFAIEAVLDIAYHAGAQPVQSREITRRQGIPRRYLEQALQNLVRGGVLVGVRGPRGGYHLARERRRISVGEIIRAVRNSDDDPLMEETGSPMTCAFAPIARASSAKAGTIWISRYEWALRPQPGCCQPPRVRPLFSIVPIVKEGCEE